MIGAINSGDTVGVGDIAVVLKEIQMPTAAGLIVMGSMDLVVLRTFRSSSALGAHFELQLVE